MSRLASILLLSLAVALLALSTAGADESAAFSPGIVANGGTDHGAQDRALRAAQNLGARRIRMGFTASEPLSVVRDQRADAEARGMELIPLLEAGGAGPSARYAENVAAWARDMGPGGPNAGGKPIRFIEFGNENSYNLSGKAGPSGGGEYADRYRAYYDAMHGSDGNSRVGLLAQADDGGTGSSEWVDRMKDAQPGICSMVGDRGGWAVHAYGPVDGYVQPGATGEVRWRNRLNRVVEHTSGIGCPSSIPIDITEDGIATRDGRPLFASPPRVNALQDNFGWRRDLTYAQAGDALRRKVAALRAKGNVGGRLRLWLLYQAMDNKPSSDRSTYRESWWGGQRQNYRDKGGYSDAIRDIMGQ